MKIIVVYNQKGGVGKTSTVSNLTAELYSRGLRVLAIDLDAQANLTSFFGVRTPSKTVRDLLLRDSKFEEVCIATKYGNLIPSDESLQMEMMRFASEPAFVIRLREIIHKQKAIYDIVLIDCPPAVNQVTAAALVAADYVLIPTEAEYFSAIGVGKIAETLDSVRPLNPELRVLGILLVKYQDRRLLTRALQAKLIQASENVLNCSVFDAHIRYSVSVPASQADGVSVFEYAPKSKIAKDYATFSDEFLRRINNERL